MSYSIVEAALLTVLRLHANYDSTNSARGDFRNLARGGARFVVLVPGSVPGREMVAHPRRISTTWEIVIQLFILYTGEANTAFTNLASDRQDIMDHIDQYPTLNGTADVVHALITSAREPEPWSGEGRNYWQQDILCRVTEHVTVTIAE